MMEKRAAKLEALQFAYDLCKASESRLAAAMLVAHGSREDRKLIEEEYRNFVNGISGRIGQLEKDLAEKPAPG